MPSALDRVDRALEPLVVLGCAWEAAAISTRRLPTVSSLCRRLRRAHPVGALVPATLVVWLAVHLFRREP